MIFQYKIIALAILLALSAWSAMAEASLLSVSRFKVRHWIEQKRLGSTYVKKLKDDPVFLLSTILITNNIVNTAAAAIITSIAINYFQSNALGIATGIGAFLILVFGEIIPKSIAASNSEKIALVIAPFVWYTGIAVYPIIKMFDYLVRGINLLIGSKKSPGMTRDELKSFIKFSEEEGSIKESEKKLIQRVFDFGNTTVADVMTRKKSMIMVESEMKIKDVMHLSPSKLYSRFPVYEKNRDTIVGILYVKDVLRHAKDGNLEIPAKEIMKKPSFVFENKRLDSMLKLFQERKEHMAVVINNKAHVVGLVTIENILEEIVGEIVDESDKINPSVVQVSKTEWNARGNAEIDTLNLKTGLHIKESDYDSLGSFISTTLRKTAKVGDELAYHGYKITVQEIQGRKVLMAKIVKNPAAKTAAPKS